MVNVQLQRRDITLNLSLQPPPDALTPPAGSRLPNVHPARNVKVFFAGVHARTHARTRVIIVFAILHFASQFPPAFALIFLSWSEVVLRDVACHPSARPIKHTVMTDWPRSKLITDWLTERGAPFCSAVFDSCLPDV